MSDFFITHPKPHRYKKVSTKISPPQRACACETCSPCKAKRLGAISMAIFYQVSETPGKAIQLDEAQVERWAHHFGATAAEVRAAIDGTLGGLLEISAEGEGYVSSEHLALYERSYAGEEVSDD